VILLDTNAVVWIVRNHRRTRRLAAQPALSVSPATLLELQFLAEVGAIRVELRTVMSDERWRIDDPPALDWMMKAAEESWTRDPFDRLIVAHARLRGWRLATGDDAIIDQLRPSERIHL
jgi:PIN domain nuclease of toxin-antitoxin system